jgi:hypothetical protein
MNSPQTASFAVDRLAPLMRALADPEGKGDLSPEETASIAQVEANVSGLAGEQQPDDPSPHA